MAHSQVVNSCMCIQGQQRETEKAVIALRLNGLAQFRSADTKNAKSLDITLALFVGYWLVVVVADMVETPLIEYHCCYI